MSKVQGATRSKTMYVAAVIAALGIIQTQADVFGMFLSPQWQGLLTMFLGVVVAVLRIVTTEPLDEK